MKMRKETIMKKSSMKLNRYTGTWRLTGEGSDNGVYCSAIQASDIDTAYAKAKSLALLHTKPGTEIIDIRVFLNKRKGRPTKTI